MGKAMQASTKLRELARVVSSDRIAKSKRNIPKSPNQVRVVPPPSPTSGTPAPKSLNVKVNPKSPKQIKMDGSEEQQSRTPLAHVVSYCVRRWFRDALSEARAGDASMQLLVGQMYNSGYGVQKNPAKGRAWINKASRGRNSVWEIGEKRPGYRESDSETDDVRAEDKQR